MDALHPCGFTPDLLDKMRAENDDYEGSEFSPSTLLECDRRTALYTTRDHWLDPENAWGLMRGHALHKYMEHLPYPDPKKVLIRETRLKTSVQTCYGPQHITGKMDLLVVKEVVGYTATCKIVDYKTKNKIDHDFTAPTRKHVMQLNVYAWLAERALLQNPDVPEPFRSWCDRIVVDELELVYMDMRKTRRFSSAGSLPAVGVKHRGATEPDMLSLEPIYLFEDKSEVERWVVSRIEEKIRAKEKLPPRLTGDEAKLCSYCPMQSVCYSLPE